MRGATLEEAPDHHEYERAKWDDKCEYLGTVDCC
jgi:hypothetical protein